jgi:hypothetical protein
MTFRHSNVLSEIYRVEHFSAQKKRIASVSSTAKRYVDEAIENSRFFISF